MVGLEVPVGSLNTLLPECLLAMSLCQLWVANSVARRLRKTRLYCWVVDLGGGVAAASPTR